MNLIKASTPEGVIIRVCLLMLLAAPFMGTSKTLESKVESNPSPVVDSSFTANELEAIKVVRESLPGQLTNTDGEATTGKDIIESLEDGCQAKAPIDTPNQDFNNHNLIARKYICPELDKQP